MNITATITGDCRYMSLVVTGSNGPATVIVRNGVQEHSLSVNIPNGGGAAHSLLFLESTVGVTNGIFQIEGSDSSSQNAYAGVFGSCSLDCCMAKKVDVLLGCDCGCIKCNSTLLQAQRVHLLVIGIETDMAQISGDPASNVGIFENAKKKYEKGLELCSDSCGCNC